MNKEERFLYSWWCLWVISSISIKNLLSNVLKWSLSICFDLLLLHLAKEGISLLQILTNNLKFSSEDLNWNSWSASNKFWIGCETYSSMYNLEIVMESKDKITFYASLEVLIRIWDILHQIRVIRNLRGKLVNSMRIPMLLPELNDRFERSWFLALKYPLSFDMSPIFHETGAA